MLWIVLAAAELAAPSSLNAQEWFSQRDCPPWLVPGLWGVAVSVAVDVDGRPGSCEAEVSSGNQQLAEYTCAFLLKRAKFAPARSQDGSPSYGLYRNFVYWAKTPSVKRPRSIPDVKVTVDRMPSGIRKPYVIDAALAVEADGKVSGCNVDPTESLRAASLFPAACDHLMHDYKAKAALLKGKAVRSIQLVRVGFDTH